MKIAFFHNLPSGGAKRSAYEWLKFMTKEHVVDLYIYDPTAEDFLDMRQYVNRVVFIRGGETGDGRYLGRLMGIARMRYASAEVARRINTGGYDLVFVMQCKVSNSPFLLRYLQKPSLYFCHEPYIKAMEEHNTLNDGRAAPIKRMIRFWLAQMDRSNARFATLICANSLYSRENIYRAYGVYPRLNYLGVDTELFHPLNSKRERIVLSVGSLCPMKAQDFILESFSYIANPPTIKFIYNYGDIRYQSYLFKIAERIGVKILFDCLPSQLALVEAYNRSMLTAFPSMMEPLGIVPLESLACATPVVGIAEAGIRETIRHQETGLLTDRDPEAFGRAIEMLIEDESLRLRMGQLGRETMVKKWTWQHSYQQLERNMKITMERFGNS